MQPVTRILRQRFKKRTKTSKTQNSTVGLSCATLISILSITIGITFTWFYASITRNLPSIEKISSLLEPPDGLYLHPTIFYDRSGTHPIYTLENPAISEREYFHLEQDTGIPEYIPNAFVAASDPFFWTHPGFNYLPNRISQKSITQRLCDELLLWREPASWQLEIRERILALQLTSQKGRQKILEWYLNSAYFGHLAYGLDSAAKIYFDKEPQDLSLAEAAMLAAISEAPALNPQDTPKAAIERQQIVLDEMVKYGFINEKEAQRAKNERLTFKQSAEPEQKIAPAFIGYVLNQITPIIPIEKIEHGGFQIITTLDFDLQIQALCTQQIFMSRMREDASEPDELFGQPCKTGRLIQTFSISQTKLPNELNTNLIIYDQHKGEILALVGQTDKSANPSMLSTHEAGSMITPFIYLTAFTRGFNPASMIWDIQPSSSDPNNTIPNPDGLYHGPIRLRIALANDYLNPAERILQQIGEDNVIITAHQLGLNSIQEPLLPDGKFSDLLHLVQAFGIFANQGIAIGQESSSPQDNMPPQPISLFKIIDNSGSIWFEQDQPTAQPIISQQLSYLITNILADEPARWQSMGHPNLLEIGRPTAVKTGFSQNYTNVWTIGYTPQIVVGVWAGSSSDSNKNYRDPLSLKISAALWRGLIQYITSDFPAKEFAKPPGVSTVRVCDPSGMLPTPQCPTLVNEVFLSGNEPTQYDNLFQTIKTNRETKHLATIFTPPELIEENTYMIVPPEAKEWAEKAGIATPPTEYDVINIPHTIENSNISSPSIFSYVSGKVDILGTAKGDNFISYRVQVGKGLNPNAWILIQEDTKKSVTDGLLAEWDTTTFKDGLYALQLIVLRNNQRIDTATIQLTLDNQPPEITIPYPTENETINYKPGGRITFRADVNDNTGISRVDFYIGTRLIDSISFPPYVTNWNLSPGEFRLRVRVNDLAGNTSEESVKFDVIR